MSSEVIKPRAYVLARQTAVRAAIDELEVDALLITTASDLTYLTGFTGDDSIGIITPKSIVLVTDFRYTEQAHNEAPWMKVVMREGKMSDALAGALADLKVGKVGFDANTTTYGQLHALKKAARDLDGDSALRLKPVQDVLVNIRKIKDDHEIGLIRQAVAAAESAFKAIRGLIRPGQTENELAGLLVYEMRKAGASNGSFPAIVATGANSSLPHYRPGQTPIQKSGTLLIDWGALYKGYCSDLTRTLFLGKVKNRIREIYQVVLEAQLAAIAALRPGLTTRQADAVARDVIDAAGYKDEFGHGLGHGIGLDIHELPSLRKTGTEEELRPGMVVTVEPGIYLPGEGGVRIEDDVLITHSGCEVLSSLDKTFHGCHLD